MKLLVHIVSQKRYAVSAITAGFIFLVLYLLSSQFLVLVPWAGTVDSLISAKLLPNWQELIFRRISSFLFESIGSIRIGPVLFFVSIPNLVLALFLSLLVALNIAVSYYSFRSLTLRGPRGFLALLSTVPAIISGAACCVPTLILVLGLQFTAILAAIWPFFIPVSILLLVAALWWSLSQVRKRR